MRSTGVFSSTCGNKQRCFARKDGSLARDAWQGTRHDMNLFATRGLAKPELTCYLSHIWAFLACPPYHAQETEREIVRQLHLTQRQGMKTTTTRDTHANCQFLRNGTPAHPLSWQHPSRVAERAADAMAESAAGKITQRGTAQHPPSAPRQHSDLASAAARGGDALQMLSRYHRRHRQQQRRRSAGRCRGWRSPRAVSPA
jgi:hypothetical protein